MLFNVKDELKSPSIITPWSAIHFLSGIVGYTFMIKWLPTWSYQKGFWVFFALHTLYEMKDHYRTYIKHKVVRDENTLLNSIGDQAIAMLGFFFASKLGVCKDDFWYYTILFVIFRIIFNLLEFD